MKLFENTAYHISKVGELRFFSDLKGVKFPDKNSEKGKYYIELANEAHKAEIPQLYASVYRLFDSEGDRNRYEKPYFERRRLLKKLIIGEIIENEGRFTDKIIDILWLILEETSWVIPAHNMGKGYIEEELKRALPDMFDEDISWIDLFSAETGALLSFAYYFMKEKFDKAVPDIINSRIKYLVDRRIIKPFIRYNKMWWMGYSGRKPNNWNPWIISNILISMAIVCSDETERKTVFEKSLECLNFFIDHYKEDGGCDEGPSYWSMASGSFFDCLEIIYDLTEGEADYFSHPLIYNMADYIRKVNISENYFAAFADSPPVLYKSGFIFGARMGERIGNKALYDFGMSITKNGYSDVGLYASYRTFKDICYNAEKADEFVPKREDILPDLQVAVIRGDKFSVASKGGNNKESHNHNDVGNFILFSGKKPLIIDIGNPTYTKDVFSDKRYTVFPINSTWHNLPVINGYGEKEGEEFVADKFCAENGRIFIEYTSAYEKCAMAEKCEREIEEAGSKLVIREKVMCRGDKVTFNYYLCEKPKKEGNIFTFEDGTKIVCPKEGSSIIEDVLVKDKIVRNAWNTDTLYRLKISGVKEFEITVE